MHALLVTLLLAAPSGDGLLFDDDAPPPHKQKQTQEERDAARTQRDRCLGAGLAGAVGVALGFVIGGGVGFGVGELVKAADTNNTSAGNGFEAFAVPAGALAGGLAGAAAGTIGAYDLTGELANKPSVMR